ncbi:MAG: dihydrodipicolinate reductase [Candidatus Diapherotrites archaeon]
MPEGVGAIFYGLGPIGREAAKLALKRGAVPVGAIDINPEIAGRDLAEVVNYGKGTGVLVSDDSACVLSMPADVVLHCTSSSLGAVKGQILDCVRHGLNVISSSEELSYPFMHNREAADEIDAAAKKHGVTVLGTGVNPGFLMDSLVVKMTGLCEEVEGIKVERVVDAGKRRLPLQKKVGAGMEVEEFKRRVAEGTLGHAGTKESIAMIADSLGWKLDRIEQTIEPMVAEKDLKTEFLQIKKGQATGIKQIGRGYRGGKEVITLDLRMYVGAEEPKDAVYIEGKPTLNSIVHGGVHGDSATIATLVNSIPSVIKAQPGLLTMKDIGHVSCWGK